MDNILGLFEKLESQSLRVQPNRCVVVRNRSRVKLCDNCLRVTVGNETENKLLLNCLNEYNAD